MEQYRHDSIFRNNEKKYYDIIVGRQERYRTLSLSFEKNVESYLIKNKISLLPNKLKETTELTRTRKMEFVVQQIIPLLVLCFENLSMPKSSAFEDVKDDDAAYEAEVAEFKNCIIQSQKAKGLAGWLAKQEYRFCSEPLPPEGKETLQRFYGDELPSNNICNLYGFVEGNRADLYDVPRYRFFFHEILKFLIDVDKGLHYKSFLPKSMYSLIYQLLVEMMSFIASIYKVKPPKKLAEDVCIIAPKKVKTDEEAFKFFSLPDVRLLEDILVIKGYNFTEQDNFIFLDALFSNEREILLRSVYFQDCHFASERGVIETISHDVTFQNCLFEKVFKVNEPTHKITFDDCIFKGLLDFSGGSIVGNAPHIIFDRCYFDKGSICDLSNLCISPFPFMEYLMGQPNDMIIQALVESFEKNHLLHLEVFDTQFFGVLKLNDLPQKTRIQMNRVTFAVPFEMKRFKFKLKPILSNLYFSPVFSIEMTKAKETLSKALDAAGYGEIAKDLGLFVEDNKKKSSFDYEAYQTAYESGWLKPEYAAYFLGKSINYLAKKRMDDKKKIARDSLPFKMDGRDIQYPVDALMSFKAKDWDKLKDLRKKYEYPAKK